MLGSRYVFVALTTMLAGCLLFRDVDALDARANAGVEVEAGSDVRVPGEGGVEAGTADASSGCPGTAGPTMVRVSTYCIDSTEVTTAEYRAFALVASTANQRPDCAWNTSFFPDQVGILDIAGDIPVAFVDFCDAAAYCAWAGKRLCGAIGGGAIALTELANPDRSQWFNACSNHGERLIPYSSYDDAICNGLDREAGSALPVGSQPGCVGGYPGLFDLSGNVREWEDGCDTAEGPQRSCLVRGGAYYDVDSTLFCSNRQVWRMDAQNPGIGLRCCSP
jgi:formylglycine-generating enzyme